MMLSFNGYMSNNFFVTGINELIAEAARDTLTEASILKTGGVKNEKLLTNMMNKTVQSTKKEENVPNINILFVDKAGRECRFPKVTSAKHVGADTTNRKKADILLYGRDERNKVIKFPISLKMDSAESWGSEDRFIGPVARQKIETALKKGLVQLEPLAGYKDTFHLTNEIVFPANREQTKEVVFGSDILQGNGCVIQNTFTNTGLNATKQHDGWIRIPVNNLYKSVGDVMNDPLHKVWFLIRNDRTRNSKDLGIRGLRVLAAYQSRTKRGGRIEV